MPGCPKTLSKPWKNVASLHSHLADHCAGKFQGTVPSQYFEDWKKEFCPACSRMRKSFSPSPSCPLPVNNLPSSALPQAINLSNPNSDFEFQTPSIEEVSSQNFPELPSIEVIVKLRSPTLKFVPKRIHSEWSRAWTETVQDCIYGNNISSYTFLFLLSKTCLRVPPSNIRSRRA